MTDLEVDMDLWEALEDRVDMHTQALRGIQDKRAALAAKWHAGGASYATIGRRIGLSRARAQQLVERGRRLGVGDSDRVNEGAIMSKRTADLKIGDVFDDGFVVTGVRVSYIHDIVEVYGMESDGSRKLRELSLFERVETASL